MGSEMWCGSIWWSSASRNTPAVFMQLSLKPLSGTMGHSPASETRGGRWFGFTGWGKARSRKPGVAPCGNPKCLQSLKLDSLVFNPVLVFERELTDKWFFFLVELSEYTYFKSVVWCSWILQLYAKGKETCLEMHYPRDTETAFWQAALPANTW